MLPENVKGRVIDRNLMFTALREESGSVIQIPNNLFFQKMFRVVGAEQSAFELLERKETVSAGASCFAAFVRSRSVRAAVPSTPRSRSVSVLTTVRLPRFQRLQRPIEVPQ